MSEVLTNGIKVPDKGSRSWYDDMRGDLVKLDALIGSASSVTVNPIITSGIEIASITVNGTSYSLYQQDGDIAVNIKPVTTNEELPILLSKSSEENTDSVDMSVGVTVNPSTNAITATTFNGALNGNASTATKATQDASGNVITDTYATNASVVHTTGDETIGGNKIFSNDIIFKSTLSVTEKPTSNQYMAVTEYDKDNLFMFSLQYSNRTTYRDITLYVTDFAGSTAGLVLRSDKQLHPLTDNEYSLGTSSRKWLNCYATTVNTSILNIPQNAIVLAFCSSAVNNGSTVAGTALKVANGGTGGAFTATTETLTGTYRALNTVDANGVGMFVKIA